MNDKHKILIVDDDPINCNLLEAILEEYYGVLTASNGVDALRICTDEHIDLVLLDVIMPEMDGYEFCKRLKSESGTNSIPVIFLTAKTNSADILRGFEVGGVDYVTKPFNIPELRARVKTHIDLKTAREEIKNLREILPLCSYCKKIRDDSGYWEQVDVYIHKYLEADISHSICQDCMKKHHPVEYEAIYSHK
jgi:DNA-binding response OmpR family regulator